MSIRFNPDEVLAFLAKAWCEGKPTKVVRSGVFTSRISEEPNTPNIIFLPSFWEIKQERLGEILKELEVRWRIYRFITWHEAQHIRFSPPRKRFTDKLFNQLQLSQSVKQKLLVRELTSIFEDYRVEKIGLQTYKYQKEQDFVKSVTEQFLPFMLNNALDERFFPEFLAAYFLTDFPENKLKEILIERLLQQNLTINVKGFPDSLFRILRQLKMEMKKIETIPELEKLICLGFNLLKEFWSEFPITSSSKDIVIFATLIPYDLASAKQLEPDETIKRELELLKKNAESQLRRFQTEITIAASFHGMIQTVQGDWLTLEEKVKPQIDLLERLLQKWKIGWIEKLDYRGYDIDPESFLLSRLKENEIKSFVDEKLSSPKTSLLILIDTSGSISSYAQLYRETVAAISSARAFCEVPFALIRFGGTESLLMKLPESPFDSIVKGRIAAMGTGGGTPLGYHLEKLAKSDLRFERMVIITDGAPNSPERAIRSVNALRKQGKRLAVLLLETTGVYQHLPFYDWLSTQPNTVVVIRELESLPFKFFKLLQYLT